MLCVIWHRIKIMGSVERRVDVAAMTTPAVGTAEARRTSWIHQYNQGVVTHISNIRRYQHDRWYVVECSRCKPNFCVMYVGAAMVSAIEVVWASIPQTTFLRQGRFCNLVSKCIAASVHILYIVPNMCFFSQV